MRRHHFTVDVEECFHAFAMQRWIPRDRWDDQPMRSPAIIDRLLELMDRHAVRGTFFTVSWLAEREPGMVRAIARAGHEIASHSAEHVLVTRQSPDEFRDSLRKSKRVLEDLTGQTVAGFRAPSWSIVPGLEWAFDILLEEGYRYDASLYPIRGHPDYGYPSASADPHWIDRAAGRLLEVPATTAVVMTARLPAAGGAYFRFFPGLVRTGLRQAERRQCPATFYIHPWELDTYVPPVPIGRVTRLRTYTGASRSWANLERLFREFRFGTIRDTLEELERAA